MPEPLPTALLLHANTYFWTVDEDKHWDTEITTKIFFWIPDPSHPGNSMEATIAEYQNYSKGDWLKDPSYSKPYNFPTVFHHTFETVSKASLTISINDHEGEDKWTFIPYLNLIFNDGSSIRYSTNQKHQLGKSNQKFGFTVPLNTMMHSVD